MEQLKTKGIWIPPSSLEEKIKHLLIPSKLYIRRLVLKEWVKGRKDIKILKYLINNNYAQPPVRRYQAVEGRYRNDPGGERGLREARYPPARPCHRRQIRRHQLQIIRVAVSAIAIWLAPPRPGPIGQLGWISPEFW